MPRTYELEVEEYNKTDNTIMMHIIEADKCIGQITIEPPYNMTMGKFKKITLHEE